MFDETQANRMIEFLVRLIPMLVILEFISDVLFRIFTEERLGPSIRTDDLTLFLVSLLFYITFGNVGQNIKSIEFKEN